MGIATRGEQKKSESGKQYFLETKKELLSNTTNTGQFKLLLAAGNQLSVPGKSKDYTWDEELNDWQHVSNTTYSYNNAGKLTEEIARDAETNYYLTRNTYSNGSGNTFEEVSYIWIIDGWYPVYGDKRVYTIFEFELTGTLEQTLENGIWVNKTWIKYIMDMNNIPTQLHEYHWDGNDWILNSRMGLLTWADWPNRELAAYTKQNMQENNWLNAERVSKQFDGDNYTETTEIWENQQWVNSTRQTYSRTSTEEELILENWTAQGWQNTEKYQGTFDNNGNPTGMKYSKWYDTDWELELELIMDLTYNESNDVTEMVIRSWNPSLTAPENLSKYIFSDFLHFTTDVPEITSLNNVKVFPNPVSNNFNIQIDENQTSNYQVNIVNLAGQTVFSNSYSNPSITINTEKFTPGMYLLNIKTDDGKIHNSKLLKQ
jgi:hypothetical protein